MTDLYAKSLFWLVLAASVLAEAGMDPTFVIGG